MCTVSWLHEAGGYHLLCNRDEKRTRRVAATPAVETAAGVRYLTPRDGEFGGSWISANECGFSVCLLNGTSLGDPINGPHAGAKRSRGLLVRDLAPLRTVDEGFETLWSLDLIVYPPFTVLLLEPGVPAGVFEWNGGEKATLPSADALPPLVSSSFDPGQVRERRRREFERIVGGGAQTGSGALFAFHASHASCPGAYSPCMHRHDAETVSFSWIRVRPREIEFFYSPAAPCRWAAGVSRSLARIQ